MLDTYCLAPGYRSRPANNANLKTTDRAQLAIYRYASDIAATDPAVRTVLDWGCGSGYKLIKLFAGYDTLGVDVDYRLPTLQRRYPRRKWAVVPVPAIADLILCVDVIEHVDDPAALLRHFAAGTWRHLIISTPERERVARHKYRSPQHRRRQLAGPPMNPWHTREWTAAEFLLFLSREFHCTPQISVLARWNLVAHVSR